MKAPWAVFSSGSVETRKTCQTDLVGKGKPASHFLCAAAEGCFSAPLPDAFAFYAEPSALYSALHGAAVAGSDGYAYLGNTSDGGHALFVRLAAGLDGSLFIGIQQTLIHCGVFGHLPGRVIKEMYLAPDGSLYETVGAFRVQAFGPSRKQAHVTLGLK